MIKLEDCRIFVVHYKKMTERKKYLSAFFHSEGLDITWIVDGQREDLTEDEIQKYYAFDPSKYVRNLSLGEIGCAIGHYKGIKQVVEENINYAVFFEDDVIFEKDFKESFNNKFRDFDEDFDLISLGDCCNIGIYGEHVGDGFYRIEPPRGRCGYAHILSNKACHRLLESLPFFYPIDWHIGAFVCNIEPKFKTFWIHPPLVSEGSKSGNYNSILR